MNNLRILVAGLFTCCSSVLFMNFDIKQDDPLPLTRKRPLPRSNGVVVFQIRNAMDAPLAGAKIALSLLQAGPESAVSYMKESDKGGLAYFGALKPGTYYYRVTTRTQLKGSAIRIGRVQVNGFNEASVKITFAN